MYNSIKKKNEIFSFLFSFFSFFLPQIYFMQKETKITSVQCVTKLVYLLFVYTSIQINIITTIRFDFSFISFFFYFSFFILRCTLSGFSLLLFLHYFFSYKFIQFLRFQWIFSFHSKLLPKIVSFQSTCYYSCMILIYLV